MTHRGAVLADLVDVVADAVDGFGPVGRRFATHPTPPAGAEVVAARDVLAPPEALDEWFNRVAGKGRARDDQALASRFMRGYCGSVTAATLIALAHGVALDVAIPRLDFVIGEHAIPAGTVVDLHGPIATSPDRPNPWGVKGELVDSAATLRQRAVHSLFADHLVPALRRVRADLRLPWRLLWTTAAEQVDALYESAVRRVDDEWNDTLAADRRAVLAARQLPGAEGPNPLRQALSWERLDDARFDRPVQLRQVCCLNFRIPDRYGPGCVTHCASCPLLRVLGAAAVSASADQTVVAAEGPTRSKSTGGAMSPRLLRGVVRR